MFMLWSECLYSPTPQIHILKSQPLKVMLLVGGAFEGCLSHEGETLMNEISAL